MAICARKDNSRHRATAIATVITTTITTTITTGVNATFVPGSRAAAKAALILLKTTRVEPHFPQLSLSSSASATRAGLRPSN
jgi:hypothetical protein